MADAHRGDSKPRRTVVVVDDEGDIAAAVAATLEAYLEDVVVETFTSPAEALPFVRNETAALLITDLRMPNIDGLDVIRELDLIAAEMPRILVTAYPDVVHVLNVAEAGGISGFVAKPFDRKRLVGTVEEVLREGHTPAQRRRAVASVKAQMRGGG